MALTGAGTLSGLLLNLQPTLYLEANQVCKSTAVEKSNRASL